MVPDIPARVLFPAAIVIGLLWGMMQPLSLPAQQPSSPRHDRMAMERHTRALTANTAALAANTRAIEAMTRACR